MSTVTLWLKVIHIAALLVWCAGLFSLPALLAGYPRIHHPLNSNLLRAKTRFGYVAVISPAGVVAIISGALLVYVVRASGGWLALKLTGVSLMMIFHVLCGFLISRLHDEPSSWPRHAHYALLLVPAALIPVVLWLVLAKPL